jgi:hypothetical protein
LHTLATGQDQLSAGQTVAGQPLPTDAGIVAATSPLQPPAGQDIAASMHPDP